MLMEFTALLRHFPAGSFNGETMHTCMTCRISMDFYVIRLRTFIFFCLVVVTLIVRDIVMAKSSKITQ